jgi:hypothetical protein
MPMNLTLDLQDAQAERMTARGGLSSLLSVSCNCSGGVAREAAEQTKPDTKPPAPAGSKR